MSDLVKQARLAQRDDRMSTGALYGDLADRIEELEAQLAEVTAYFDDICAELNEQIKVRVQENTRAEAAEAAIPRAYQMGLEAAAVLMDNFTQADHVAQDIKNGIFPQQSPKREAMASSIRAMTPPANLVERVLKTKETNT